MNRQIGFYLIVPGLSLYLIITCHFIYKMAHSYLGYTLEEGEIIFLSASAILLIPISLILIMLGNNYISLFKKKRHIFLLYVPVVVTLLMSLFS